jgi:hypothetical protein
MPRPVWTFLGLVWSEWATRITGSFSAVLVALSLGINIAGALGSTIPAGSVIQLATWILAMFCGGYATFSVWYRERYIREKLENRLTPKLNVIYDPKIPSCRALVEFRGPFGQYAVQAICFRLEISGIGPSTVHDCEGHLIEVFYEGENAELAPINLTWTGPANGITKIDIIENVKCYLDILNINEYNDISPCCQSWPHNRQDFFKRRGNYIFKVVISARDAATLPPYCMRLAFNGDWQTAMLEPS